MARKSNSHTKRVVQAVQGIEQILLGDGYRMTDTSASKGPGVAGPAGDTVAVSFLAQNGGNLFKATAAERNDPGKLGGPLTPEQAALSGAVGNPALGLGTAIVITGGLAAPALLAGPAGDAVAVSFIAQNAGNLFKATAVEYNNAGKIGGSLTPEQAALPGAVGNPLVGLATAGVVTGGVALAGIGTGALIAGVADVWTAYKAAQAAYSMGLALGTGAAVGGASYTGGVAAGAVYDSVKNGQTINAGFDQRFSYSGLVAATTVGGLTGMYGTAMFSWAGVPNALSNWLTVPGFVIRANSAAAGKAAGSAAQAAVKSSTNK